MAIAVEGREGAVTGKRICMAALPRRKSLKLRLVELREGKLGSREGGVLDSRGCGGWWRCTRNRGRRRRRRRWRVIIRPLGVAG